MQHPDIPHIPVLLNEVLAVLAPTPGERYLDLTAGYGGHARAVLQKTGTTDTSLLIDRDQYALDHLGDLQAAGSRLIHADYHAAALELSGHETFDLILADLGVSSPQLDLAERGFSFMKDGPLDMRMNQTAGKTAADIVNGESTDHLSGIITEFGEESTGHARQIAQAIVLHRPILTTSQLAQVVTNALGGRRGKIHPATKTFQALRLAVNDELGQLRDTLPLLPGLLNRGGRVAIISFHSLEDRIVKQYFKDQAPQTAGFEATLRILTPKPIESGRRVKSSIPNDSNPRARSAKLRAAVKI